MGAGVVPLVDVNGLFGERTARKRPLPHEASNASDDADRAELARDFMRSTLHRHSNSKKNATRAATKRLPVVLRRPRRATADGDDGGAADMDTDAAVVSLTTMFDDMALSVEQRTRDAIAARRVPKTYELYTNPVFSRATSNGDACLANMRRTLDEFGFKRHSNQLHFHEEMMKACLRIIYRHDFEQNIDRVLAENDWTRIVQEVLIITARRIGKTTAVAMFAAALLICVPSVELMIFSVSLNSSRKMQLMIKDFLMAHPVGRGLITQTSMDKMTLDVGPTDRRTCESRPGSGEVGLCVVCVYCACAVAHR